MTKADALKVPTRRETVILKVYIHCEECQKQVKKALKKLDGVESIAVDAELGKVTVIGSVAASTLMKKLSRAGKYAALWSSATYSTINVGAIDHDTCASSSKTKHRQFAKLGNALDQSSTSSTRNTHPSSHMNNFPHKLAGACAQDDVAGEGGGEHHDMNMYQNLDQLTSHNVHNYMNGSSKKGMMKGGKKVSFQGAAPHAMSHASLLAVGTTSTSADPYFHTNVLLTGNSTLTSAVERSYHNTKMDSVEYATNMFSDENAHSCSLM